ncbi:hypothetical protein HPB50_000201 [Hyalomma asiaticum]|uniref:Uncharacterized protein n=1 Tax=Hyalomma asiaticum TaxID=266040 RepID=A0ACB7TAA3_HYAAI|nr:hypothetical protein HPB50_000201 [Hyalomma asiaticum]
MMRSYTVAKKIEVVQWRRQAGKNVHETSRHFNIERKRIREWDGKYKSLLQQNFGKLKLRRKLSNGAPVFSEELDDALFEFFERERSAGRAATNESQKTSDDYAEAARAFRSSVNELRLRHGYTPFNMADMNQTMVRMDCPASRTNNIIGESSVRMTNTGCAWRGFTVALTACASGHKLPAFVILKEPSGKIPTKAFMKLCVPANVHVTASKKGWMSSDKLQEWLLRVWGPNTDDVRRLLVLDQAPIHKTQAARDALEERETDVAYVPAGGTSILQPVDVYWNWPFKANFRRSWEEFMRRAERKSAEAVASRRPGFRGCCMGSCQRKLLPRASEGLRYL